MPTRPTEWRVSSFWSSDECRAEAEVWETIGNSAELDGDHEDAKVSRHYARQFRQIAREKQADADRGAP